LQLNRTGCPALASRFHADAQADYHFAAAVRYPFRAGTWLIATLVAGSAAGIATRAPTLSPALALALGLAWVAALALALGLAWVAALTFALRLAWTAAFAAALVVAWAIALLARIDRCNHSRLAATALGFAATARRICLSQWDQKRS
jgi:hypothetical protein